MFVRQKKNKSGVISIQIIDKSSGKYKLLKTIGSSSDSVTVDSLILKGQDWIQHKQGLVEFDFTNEKQIANTILDNINSITVLGTELLLGKIFDEIGFHKIEDDLFRRLVIARLCYPVSKLKTSGYLLKHQSTEIDVQQIYRYLDKLYNRQKDLVQQISYEHTLKILNNTISVVFYDVTTLYFETDDQDSLRKTGFSKDGKHQHPQIVLGLLVSIDGYPLAYEIFEGNKFEGHTMLPVIDKFKLKYNIQNLVVIADSGLLSQQNINDLQTNHYDYILGARIKNEKQSIQELIFDMQLKNGESKILKKDKHINLVVSYSQARAKKDRANREKGLQKLEKQIISGKLTKANINNRGYNKYLKLDGEIKISIDKSKFETDSKWDGLKGYLTNTILTKEEIIENYNQLWKIEKAFRIAKTDLKIRPIFHRVQRRIEAHICIAFVAYKINKELERQLKEKNSKLSPEKAIEIAKTIYHITLTTPNTKEIVEKTLIINQEQQELMNLFDL